MNTHDQAGALEDKPRLLLCDDCNKNFLSRDRRTVCAECNWKKTEAQVARTSPFFNAAFEEQFGNGRR